MSNKAKLHRTILKMKVQKKGDLKGDLVTALRPISTSFAIRKSHAILCLKFACERSQIACERSQCDFDLFAMFDFLRTFACEPLSPIESSQSENNFMKQRDKGDTRYQKETDLIG